MTHELKLELLKFVNDTPAYGAIILTKLANPDPHFYNNFEAWLYDHGWSVILLYRLYKVVKDIHKGLLEKTLWRDDSGQLTEMTGYDKLFLQLKSLIK